MTRSHLLGLVDDVDHKSTHTMMVSDKLTELRRRYAVVDLIGIEMISEVERVNTESNFAFVGVAHIRHTERKFAKNFEIERKERREPLAVLRSHVVLENVDTRVRQKRPSRRPCLRNQGTLRV